MSSELLDIARVEAWIGDRLPGAGRPLRANRMGEGAGIANALFLLRRGEHEWVLRRPPAVVNAPGASDIAREWRLLRALDGTPVPHPEPLLFCDDADVIGAPFLVMRKVEGFTPGFELPQPFANDLAAQRALGFAYVDGLVALAGVDWRARGLDGLGRPDGFLERQVNRWLGQLDRYRTRPLADLDFVAQWLERNRPPGNAPAIIHGDYSPFNVMVAPDLPVRLTAIVDWDTGTIGDPLLDIGHLLARWTEAGEEPIIPGRELAAPATRAELAHRYALGTGRDVTQLRYYEVLALFKLAVILEGNYARAAANGVPYGENQMATLVPRILAGAAQFARGDRT